MIVLYLDLLPENIPFVVQCTKGDGTKIDPTVDKLILYEEDGKDLMFSDIEVNGSPFNPEIVNSKTGLWGTLIPKNEFSAHKIYLALWEMTIDGIQTSKIEKYFVCNSRDFHLPKESQVFKYRLIDEKMNPIKEANIVISEDFKKKEIIFRGNTNENGEISFDVKDDTFTTGQTIFVWRNRRGYTFKNPEEQKIRTWNGSGKKISFGPTPD